jgi:hypothetical protein
MVCVSFVLPQPSGSFSFGFAVCCAGFCSAGPDSADTIFAKMLLTCLFSYYYEKKKPLVNQKARHHTLNLFSHLDTRKKTFNPQRGDPYRIQLLVL